MIASVDFIAGKSVPSPCQTQLESKDGQRRTVWSTAFAICCVLPDTRNNLRARRTHAIPRALSRGRLKGPGEALHVVLDLPVLAQELNICTVDLEPALRPLLHILLTTEGSEAPVLGHDDLLPAGELVLRASKSFEGSGAV